MRQLIASVIPAMLVGVVGTTAPAFAQQPESWQFGFQSAASPIKQQMVEFHNLLLWIITAITLFVLGLLIYVLYKFSHKRSTVPSTMSHNTTIEIIWTVVPVAILVVIAIPSYQLIQKQEQLQDAEMTVKAVGRQWYWQYEYEGPNGTFIYDSYMIPDEDITGDQVRLLSVDNPMVLPADTKIRFLVTAGDVLHAFAMPALGVKTDAIPGNFNETWTMIDSNVIPPGTSIYGQCSEICGTGHGYMPIEIKVVSQEEFGDWLAEAEQQWADYDIPAPRADTQLAAR
jgi:cytochrome c oxidase subunit 2